MTTPTSALVEILHLAAPEQLERLRAAHPSSAALFGRGRMLGGASASDDTALRELAQNAVAVAGERARRVWSILQAKIRRTLRLRLAASALSALASAGVIGLLSLAHHFAALISAVLAFSGAGLTLLAQYTEDLAGGASGSPTALKDKLAGLIADLALLEGELELAVARGTTSDLLADLVRRANILVAEVRRIEFASGVDW